MAKLKKSKRAHERTTLEAERAIRRRVADGRDPCVSESSSGPHDDPVDPPVAVPNPAPEVPDQPDEPEDPPKSIFVS